MLVEGVVGVEEVVDSEVHPGAEEIVAALVGEVVVDLEVEADSVGEVEAGLVVGVVRVALVALRQGAEALLPVDVVDWWFIRSN